MCKLVNILVNKNIFISKIKFISTGALKFGVFVSEYMSDKFSLENCENKKSDI